MIRSIVVVLAISLMCLSIVEGQKITLVEQDRRIVKHQCQLVKYLIEKKQLVNERKDFKLKYFRNKYYITKCLEFYHGPSGELLLVRFGNLDDHGWSYWGLLNENFEYLFTDTKGEEFERMAQNNPQVVTLSVKAFIEAMEK